MDERKGDPRIYVVSILFFSCIVSGGVFLGLYIFLNANDVKPWYPYVGLILVGIPWMFWIFAYLYRCFIPDEIGMQPRKSSMISLTASNTEANENTNPTSDKSPVISPRGSDGKRHVHFGGVVVISENGNDNGSGGNDHHGNEGMEGNSDIDHDGSNTASHERKDSAGSRESEMPLNLSVSS